VLLHWWSCNENNDTTQNGIDCSDIYIVHVQWRVGSVGARSIVLPWRLRLDTACRHVYLRLVSNVNGCVYWSDASSSEVRCLQCGSVVCMDTETTEPHTESYSLLAVDKIMAINSTNEHPDSQQLQLKAHPGASERSYRLAGDVQGGPQKVNPDRIIGKSYRQWGWTFWHQIWV